MTKLRRPSPVSASAASGLTSAGRSLVTAVHHVDVYLDVGSGSGPVTLLLRGLGLYQQLAQPERRRTKPAPARSARSAAVAGRASSCPDRHRRVRIDAAECLNMPELMTGRGSPLNRQSSLARPRLRAPLQRQRNRIVCAAYRQRRTLCLSLSSEPFGLTGERAKRCRRSSSKVVCAGVKGSG